MRWTWLWLVVCVTGCDAIDLRRLVTQHEARTRITPEPAGPNCEHGGKAVRSGLDLDANGVLDDAEVTGTEYVCATLAPGVLVRTRPVPRGEACPHGGSLSQAGTDLDGDGILSDDEVTREVQGCIEPEPVRVVARVRPLTTHPYVCRYDNSLVEAGVDLNGNGVLDEDELRAAVRLCSNSEVTLLRQRPEPVGPNCATGGTVVEAGVDGNRNAVLDDAEVLAATYVCQPTVTHHGTLVVEDAADLEALRGLSSIRGNLTIQAPDLVELVLPGLVSVDGTLEIHGSPALRRVELAALRYVEGTLSIGGSAQLTELSVGPQAHDALPQVRVHSLGLRALPALPSLAGLSAVVPLFDLAIWDTGIQSATDTLRHVPTLHGTVSIFDNAVMEELPLSRLAEVGGSVEISGNPALQSLSGLEHLSMVGGGISITNNGALTSVSGLKNLMLVKNHLRVADNPQLRDVRFESLSSLHSLAVTGNANLEHVGTMPSLLSVQWGISLEDNPRLTSVTDLPELQSLGSLSVTRNALLTDLSGFHRVTWMSGLFVTGNDALTDLGTLSALHALGTLEVRDNPALTRLNLRALADVRRAFYVTGNARLPSCWATLLADSTFTGPPEERFIGDNDSHTPCQM
ncbi:hypothetical protein [Comamonas sp. JC664]|uniref:DUF7151 family protein n=1 Tax=Comamonas sp. JC664 TaxID=2801917 RepID=UPI00174E913A|nr:hypothetical protein [Comamonas sp. JC664]MBL0698593.1 hypothetical protein [Comamonas sp. JC664]GHH00631.1 hypothetical protein GCM10012319_67990 [Comamonas sp. KCTC 72670]